MNRSVGLGLVFVLWLAVSANAQVTVGTVFGSVEDSSGAPLAGASVSLVGADQGLQRDVTTDESGRFRVLALPFGRYDVIAQSNGLASQRRTLVLSVGQDESVHFRLDVVGLHEELDVQASPMSLDVVSPAHGALIDGKTIRELPLNGRDLGRLLILQPGVVWSRASVQSSGTGRGMRFSVAGASPSQNLFVLDGTILNDALNNTPGSAQGLLLGVDAIEEFRVVTRSWGADVGRAAGGVVIARTRSGTNGFHGSMYGFYRNDALDSRNYFDVKKPDFEREQFGGSLGGPIRRDRTFFFANIERLRENRGVTTISLVPDDNARAGQIAGQHLGIDPRALPILDLYPRANGKNLGGGIAEYAGVTKKRADADLLVMRVDHKISPKSFVFVRYLFEDSSQVLPRNFPEFPNLASNRKHAVAGEERYIASDRLLGVTRLAYTHSRPAEVVGSSARTFELIRGRGVGAVTVAGLSDTGTDTATPAAYGQHDVQATTDWTMVAGRHTLQGGFSAERFGLAGVAESRSRGQIRFRSLTDLLQFRVQDLQGAAADSDFARNVAQWLLGAYLQDRFLIGKRLNVETGVRIERATAPVERDGKVANLRSIGDPQVTVGNPIIEPPTLQIAPRVGFAFDVTGDGRTAVRGGIGVYQDPPLFAVYRLPAYRSLPFVNRGRLAASQVPSLPVEPSIFTGVDRVTDSIDPNLDSTYLVQYSLGVDHAVGAALHASATYMGSRGVNLLGYGDVNIAIPVLDANGREFFPAGGTRRNANFDAVRRTIQGFSSRYHGLATVLAHRGTRLNAQVAYTLGTSTDDGVGLAGRLNWANGQGRSFDPYRPELNQGRSNFDVRHSLGVTASWELPFRGADGTWGSALAGGWSLNLSAHLSSGVPFSPLVDGDPDRDATDENQARPDLVPGASVTPPGGPTPEMWFNPAAFTAPSVGYRGSAGRNILTGPDYRSVDVAAVKRLQTGKGTVLEFRLEVFNVLNRANFDLPANAADGAVVFNFVPAAAGQPATFVPAAGVGRIFRTVDQSREAQLGVRLSF